MQIDFDSDSNESILHLNAEELGKLLFALDVTAMSDIAFLKRREAALLRDEIRTKMEEPKQNSAGIIHGTSNTARDAFTWCGLNDIRVTVTDNADEVTCNECKKTFEGMLGEIPEDSQIDNSTGIKKPEYVIESDDPHQNPFFYH